MVNWPASLVREIAERRVVLFVGTGVSKAAVPNLPSWADLLLELAVKAPLKKDEALIKRMIKSGRLLDAAELANSLLQPADRRLFLEDKFLLVPPPTSKIYSNLLDLDFKVCITTNYDQLLEKNFEHFSGGEVAYKVRTHQYNNLLADLRSPARTVLKLHGCITDPGQVVLDRQSYFKARAANPGIYDVVTALLTVNTVLFLGYSLNDPDIKLILERIHARARSDHTHYALVPKFEHPSLRTALGETFNVQFVEYPAGVHAVFPKAIEDLRGAVKEVRAERGIP